MVREKFAVRLTPEERNQLEHMVRAGKGSARVINRARILLKTGEGWSAPKVAQALDVAQGTVLNVKRRFAEGGLDGVLKDRPQAHRYRKMDDRAEGHLIALACSPAPEGHEQWNLRLLADRMVELGVVESLSYETVRLHLKKHNQAVAEETVVHSSGERRLRGPHGGRAGSRIQYGAGSLRRTLRPSEAGGLFRRDLHPTSGRYPAADTGAAGAPQTGGLRVPKGGHPQPVPLHRAPGGLAACGGDGAAHHRGLCPPDALAGGRGLP